MLKARAQNMLIMGLSAENMRRLAAGQPIIFSGSEFGLSVLNTFEFCIISGDTEQTIFDDLQEMLKKV